MKIDLERAEKAIEKHTNEMEDVLEMLTNGLSTRSFTGSFVRTYRIGLSGTYALVNGMDKEVTLYNSFFLEKQKALREFVYSLEGTKLFGGRLFRLADVLGEIENNEIELEEYKLKVNKVEGTEDMLEVQLKISTDYEKDETVVEELSEEDIEEEIEEEEDEENPDVLYDSSEEDEEQDEEQDEKEVVPSYKFDWSLEVAGETECIPAYYPTLKDLIESALENENCIKKGSYITHFDGESYVFAEEETKALNKMLKGIEIDEKLPF